MVFLLKVVAKDVSKMILTIGFNNDYLYFFFLILLQ
jgi:hypothetical protein